MAKVRVQHLHAARLSCCEAFPSLCPSPWVGPSTCLRLCHSPFLSPWSSPWPGVCGPKEATRSLLRVGVAQLPSLWDPFTLGAAPTPGTTPVQCQSPSGSSRRDSLLTSVAGISDQLRYYEAPHILRTLELRQIYKSLLQDVTIQHTVT